MRIAFNTLLLTCIVSAGCLFAGDENMFEETAEKIGCLTNIQWSEKKLTEAEEQFLFEAVKSPQDDIASRALVVATVRGASNLAILLDAAIEFPKGNRAKMAHQLQNVTGQENIRAHLVTELKSRPYFRSSAPQVDDYLRNIIVCFTILEARKENRPPKRIPELQYNLIEKSILKYGYFTEKEAFESIFRIMNENADKISEQNACMIALSAYSRVFLVEAENKINQKDLSKTVKETLLFYLRVNRARMTSEQIVELDKIMTQSKSDSK